MGLETLAAVAVIGTGASVVQSTRARRQSRRAQRAQSRIESRQAQRQKMEQLRSSQRAQSDVIAQAGAQGTLDSSGVQGGVASIGTQAANNISFIEQVDSAKRAIQSRLERAGTLQAQAQGFGQLASMAVSATPLAASKSTSSPAPVVDLNAPSTTLKATVPQ